MATVSLAHDLKHDCDVAIKVLHPDLGAALGGDPLRGARRHTATMLLGAAALAAVTAGATYLTQTGLVATTVDLAAGVKVDSTRELLGAEFVSDDITHAPFDVGPDGTVVFVRRPRVIPRPSFRADLYALACIMHLLRSSVARFALIRLSSLSRLSLTASFVLQTRARWRSRGPDCSFYS